MVCLKSVPPSSQSQDQPWLGEFPLYRFLHEVRAPHCGDRKALPVLQARVRTHQVEHIKLRFIDMRVSSDIDENTLRSQSINDFLVDDVAGLFSQISTLG